MGKEESFYQVCKKYVCDQKIKVIISLGGQKARVSLARAVYADRDILLMDDPISALDANVKKNVFKEVFQGICKNKTRVLVTHAVDFLRLADVVCIMDKGRIAAFGPLDSLKDNLQLQEILKVHYDQRE